MKNRKHWDDEINEEDSRFDDPAYDPILFQPSRERNNPVQKQYFYAWSAWADEWSTSPTMLQRIFGKGRTATLKKIPSIYRGYLSIIITGPTKASVLSTAKAVSEYQYIGRVKMSDIQRR
jgi:hypothetical protein